MTKLTAEELKNCATVSRIKVMYTLYGSVELTGVINGDKINWDDGSHNEIWEIATAVQKGRCIVYSVGHNRTRKTSTFSRYN